MKSKLTENEREHLRRLLSQSAFDASTSIARVSKDVDGNWRGYLGNGKAKTFTGSSDEQWKKAWQWLRRLGRAAPSVPGTRVDALIAISKLR